MRTLGAVALALWAAGCASAGGGVPRPFPGAPVPEPAARAPEPPAAPGAYAGEDGIEAMAIVRTALDFQGVPYRNGGTDPSGFDCSGLTYFVFWQHGVQLPREVRDQFGVGERVRRERLQAGDLVFFSTVGRGATHVGISLGDDRFVHAPSSAGVVRVELLTSRYWSRRFVGARRMLP